jgi:hypothetical protein
MPNYIKLALAVFSVNKPILIGKIYEFMNCGPTPTSKLFGFDSKGNVNLTGRRGFMNFRPTPTSSLFVLSSKNKKVNFDGILPFMNKFRTPTSSSFDILVHGN